MKSLGPNTAFVDAPILRFLGGDGDDWAWLEPQAKSVDVAPPRRAALNKNSRRLNSFLPNIRIPLLELFAVGGIIPTGFGQPDAICEGIAIPLKEVESALRMAYPFKRNLQEQLVL